MTLTALIILALPAAVERSNIGQRAGDIVAQEEARVLASLEKEAVNIVVLRRRVELGAVKADVARLRPALVVNHPSSDHRGSGGRRDERNEIKNHGFRLDLAHSHRGNKKPDGGPNTRKTRQTARSFI